MIKIIYSFVIVVTILNSLMFAQFTNSDVLSLNGQLLFNSNDYIVRTLHRANSESIQLDSIVTYNLSGDESGHSFKYNENNKISEWLWDNSLLDKYYYNETNYLTTIISFGLNGTEWDSLNRRKYTYEGNRLSNLTFQVFSIGNWLNSSRQIFEYDSIGNASSIITEFWEDTYWDKKTMFQNYYSYPNKKDSALIFTWSNDSWRKEIKLIYFLNNNGVSFDSIIVKTFSHNIWENRLMRELKYDENQNEVEQLDKIWKDNVWNYSNRQIYTYNKFNLIEEAFCQQWIIDGWFDSVGEIFFQNQSSEEIKAVFEAYGLTAFYLEITSVSSNLNVNLDEFSLSQNFPNPFNPTTQISYTIKKDGFVNLIVYNTLGQEVAQLVNQKQSSGKYSVQFNATNLPSGVYIYKLQASEFSSTKKMLLMK